MLGVNTGAPHQVGGGSPHTDWLDWEQAKGIQSSRGWWDDPSLFEQDLRLAKELGVATVRVGVEWARIEPEKSVFDRTAIARYRSIIERLQSADIKPMVTFQHFTLPYYITNEGGWANPTIVSNFAQHALRVAGDIAPDVPYVLTVNEPSVFLPNGYLKGIWPPGRRVSPKIVPAFINVVRAHNTTYDLLKIRHPQMFIGASETIRGFIPHSLPQTAEMRIRELLFNNLFFLFTSRHQDFLGMNYFGVYPLKSARLGDGADKGGLLKTDNGFVVSPENFLNTVEKLYQKFRKPIIITEHGVAGRDDRIRSFSLLSSLLAIHRAMERGVPIEGYLYWSLTDTTEWGMSQENNRFGLVAVDMLTATRTRRESYKLYARVCRTKRIDQSLVDQYVPSEQRPLLDQIYP